MLYLISGLLLPIFFTSIVVYMPWPRLAISIIILLMFTLSLIARRYDAALQVNEMIYFVRKAMEDLPPVEVAKVMGRSRIGVRVLLHRARSALVAEIAKRDSANSMSSLRSSERREHEAHDL